MSKKIAAASIVCMVFGGISVPGGIFVNDMISDMTYGMVDDGLLGIQEQAGPIINDIVLHTFSALLINTCLTDMSMDFEGFPIEIEGLDSDEYFNDPECVFKVGVYMDMADLAAFMGLDLGFLGLLFGWVLQLNVDVMELDGISKYHEGNLGFTGDAQELLLYGDGDLPGLITDIDTGSGVAAFIELYEAASTETLQQEMEDNYLCTWEQLTAIYTFIQDYIIGEMIQAILDGFALNIEVKIMGIGLPSSIIDMMMGLMGPLLGGLELPEVVYVIDMMMPEISGLGTPEEIGEFMFFQQWANGTLMPDPGFPLPLKAGEKFGFEVGIPEPTEMSIESAMTLWDQESPYSLTSGEGIAKWLQYPEQGSDLYNELRDANGLNDDQMDLILLWLDNFQHNLMPFLAQEDMSLPMDSISLGNLLQIVMIGAGGLMVGLGSTGLVSNRVVKHKARKRALDKFPKKGPKKGPKKLPDIAGDPINPEGRTLTKIPAEQSKEIKSINTEESK